MLIATFRQVSKMFPIPFAQYQLLSLLFLSPQSPQKQDPNVSEKKNVRLSLILLTKNFGVQFSLICIGHSGKYHNTLCLSPQMLHKHCFQFLLGLTMVPRENKNNAYAKFGGTNKEYYGIFWNGQFDSISNEVADRKRTIFLKTRLMKSSSPQSFFMKS